MSGFYAFLIKMKIRNGLVSNSSTSSFIINGNIRDISENMLNTVICDFSEWDSTDVTAGRRTSSVYKKWKTNLKKGLKKKEILNGTMGIAFPSCNYDTYIIMVDNKCYIKTANNHQWEIEAPNVDDNEDEYNKIENAHKDKYFYDVRNGLIHSDTEYDSTGLYCEICKGNPWAYVVDNNGNKICASCYEGKLGLSKEFLEEQKYKKALEELPKFPTPFDDLRLD